MFIRWRSAQSKEVVATLSVADFTAFERNPFAFSMSPDCIARRIMPMSASWLFSSFSSTFSYTALECFAWLPLA